MSKQERGLWLIKNVWYIRYAVNGKLKLEKAGESKTLAKKLLAKRRTELAEHKFFPRTKRVTFGELLDDAVERWRQTCRGRFDPGNFNRLKTWLGERDAAVLTPQELSAVISSRVRTPATFNRYRACASMAYRRGAENGKVTVNPVRFVKLRQENNQRVRYLAPDEVVRLRQACGDRWREVEFARNTGLRWAEQYRLRWADVQNGLIRLNQTKAGGAQHVPLNAAAAACLIPNGDERVFPVASYDEHRWWFCQALTHAGVVNFHWHDLRHDFASNLAMRGADLLTIQKLLRHQTLAMTLRYAHLSPNFLRDAVEKLAASAPADTETAAPPVIN